MNYRIIFFGSGDFAIPILGKLIESKYKPIAVITQPDMPAGRKKNFTPPPIKSFVLKCDIKIYQPEKIKNKEIEKIIQNILPDLIIVADYGKVIPKNILDIPKFGALNIHPSLLPKYRGPSPIQYTILNNDRETGVTIILMDEKVDHGPIIKNAKFKIKNAKLTYSELLQNLANLGGNLLLETLPKWLSGEIKPMTQDEAQATYTKILTRQDGKINWQKSAESIERQIRAFEKWPQSWCEWPTNDKNLRLKILKAKILHPTVGYEKNNKPGFVFLTAQKEMAANCNPGSLVIEELQLEGRNKMSNQEFLRGYPKIVGSILA